MSMCGTHQANTHWHGKALLQLAVSQEGRALKVALQTVPGHKAVM